MAFHFDARADSSDEDAAIDLSKWKTGANHTSDVRLTTPDIQPFKGKTNWTTLKTGQNLTVTPGSAAKAGNMLPKSASSSSPPPTFQAINKASKAVEVDNQSDSIGSISLPDIPSSDDELASRHPVKRQLLHVAISPPPLDRNEFEDFTGGSDIVNEILYEVYGEDENVLYVALFEDFSTKKIPVECLRKLRNGAIALQAFNNNTQDSVHDDSEDQTDASGQESMPVTRAVRTRRQPEGFVNTVDFVEGDESEDELAGPSTQVRKRKHRSDEITQYVEQEESSEDDDGFGDREVGGIFRRSARRQDNSRLPRSLRSSARQSTLVSSSEDDNESDDDSDDYPVLDSDLPGAKRRKVMLRLRKKPSSNIKDDIDFDEVDRGVQRHSARSTRHIGGMQEVEIDDIYRSESDNPRAPAKPKPIGVREVFKILPRNDEFRMRHIQQCEVCGQGSNFAPLIDCQGCSLTYHKSCLGHRTNREHLVTKVGDGDFVLQCRRCTAFARTKDHTAPDHGMCQECRQHGSSCRPFRKRKTPAQEQKDREENDGVDPTYDVDPSRINNVENILFRCTNCFRGFHFEHLPSRNDILEIDTDIDAEQRFREYSRDWKCKECMNMPAKVSGLVAWKPLDEDMYDPSDGIDGVAEDDKAYLVRWEGRSYFAARWMPGAWVWGVTAHSMRKAFSKREDAQHPKMRTEDAIPEDYLRADIVLDIKFTSIVDIRTEEVDKARIREVEKALIKYKGLSYEDAVWEAPPSPEDGERWTDFVMAYNDWVAGRYVRQPKPSALKIRLEKARAQEFNKLEKQSQPEKLEGGKLMKYQIEGLNWLYYKWFTQKNAILADEMGLGKTIQIIGFIATLVQDWNCFPFLIVVPNSTCPNWRREIKRWAPSLRVVAYYGSRDSREAAYRYELYPEGSRDLRCHIVVTSYDAAADDNCRKFFRGVQWQGLIVDEGQRLKSSETQLYSALGALKAPFKILLTGTPLQNNQRELFNLLQFIDDTFDAAALEEKYQDLDQTKITELHNLIRPFFLRRTKAQVLTFLPPMSQIILPVSMTIVQKKVYRSILAKNPELMRAIFSTESGAVKQTERASLNNILMQLRKCLCHPFVYNKSIEDRNVSYAASHRNLVDASSKLMLLELLLPRLQERGHRILIFSQFLDMLDMVEDFLDGMTMKYHRLDGTVNSLTKQKRIDEFNAPDSPYFAFILSTRAGGVGINLATADTVIILDPDFNPHQDIQALSRAHRIGQTKKVLCFQLVTRASAEERIMQIGRKKLALDHVLIQEMDADDASENDLVSILRYGANELFESNSDQDITYDGPSVDRLLDRSHMDDTQASLDATAETQFSFARVWANNQGALQDAQVDVEEHAPDPGVWANILKERERVAAAEAAAKAESFGRGRRARAIVDYGADKPEGDGLDLTPLKKAGRQPGGDSDTDFQAEESDGDDDGPEGEIDMGIGELVDLKPNGAKRVAVPKHPGKQTQHLPIPIAISDKGKGRKIGEVLRITKPVPKASAPLVKKAIGKGNKDDKKIVRSDRVVKPSPASKPVARKQRQISTSKKIMFPIQNGAKGRASALSVSKLPAKPSDEGQNNAGQSSKHPILVGDDNAENASASPLSIA